MNLRIIPIKGENLKLAMGGEMRKEKRACRKVPTGTFETFGNLQMIIRITNPQLGKALRFPCVSYLSQKSRNHQPSSHCNVTLRHPNGT